MKKVFKIFLVAFIALIISGCTTSKTYSYDVSTGDKVSINFNTTGGYDISTDNPFVISKNDETISQGMFMKLSAYDTYKNIVDSGQSTTLLDSGTKDNITYIFYEYDGETTEYNYVIKLNNSNTAVILGNALSKESAEEVFDRITFSLEE